MVPIHLFPEGTTTNGSAILEFKKGAFVHLKPVKLLGLKYNYTDFNPAYDVMNPLDLILLTFCQLKNNVTLYEFPVIEPE